MKICKIKISLIITEKKKKSKCRDAGRLKW
jgi:hypothetical protein